MARSVNLAILVGNLTRDPQMRYTPQGTAVATFSVATNRSWISDGKEQEATDFHNIVVWNKLAETCNNLLSKGRKVFVRGRISNRSWEDSSGQKKYRTEIVAEEVLFLDAPREKVANDGQSPSPVSEESTPAKTDNLDNSGSNSLVGNGEEDVNAEDIPF